jgi:hypothetical protein
MSEKPMQDEYSDSLDTPKAMAALAANENLRKFANRATTNENISILRKYYRHPGIHITLPSRGYFNTPGDIDFTINGEVPIYPMTAADELILKNPDALLNGFSIEKVITSCCPNVHNVRSLPSSDVDMILMAIRVSTYGDNVEMEIDCPECEHHNSFSANLRQMLSSVFYMEKEYSVRVHENIMVYIKPYTFEVNTRAALAAFEEGKNIQIAETQELKEEEKVSILNRSYERIIRLTAEFNAASIIKIVVPDGIVTDKQEIVDFLMNTDKKTSGMIDDAVKKINETGVVKKYPIECTNCKHKWEPELAFDPARFFE